MTNETATTLDEVLAEEWLLSEPDRDGAVTLTRVQPSTNTVEHIARGWLKDGGHTRLGAALLGHRALALVLEHEWSGRGGDDDNRFSTCPECDGMEPGEQVAHYQRDYPMHEMKDLVGHRHACTWAAIVEEARKLG